MKIGISTVTFFNTIAPESMFELLRNMRVDTTEVCLNTFSEYEKAYIDKLASMRKNMNVIAVSPLATQFEPQLFSPNPRVRADAETIFKKVCYACFAMGAKYYTFRGPVNLNGARDFEYTHLAQRINQLADTAATYGVSLSLKNMRWSFASTPEFFRKILSLCPKLYVTLDLFNAECVGYDLREFMDVVPPAKVSLIEVADVIKGDWRLPGNGKFNFERFLADLDRRKISAPVLISVRSDCYSDFVQVRSSFEFLSGLYARQKHGK